jgi:hypothetical protein
MVIRLTDLVDLVSTVNTVMLLKTYDYASSKDSAYSKMTGSMRPALRKACASKPGPLATYVRR